MTKPHKAKPTFLLSVCECVCVCVKSLSHVRRFATPWTAARQAPLSMGFSRQEYWSGCSTKQTNFQIPVKGSGNAQLIYPF